VVLVIVGGRSQDALHRVVGTPRNHLLSKGYTIELDTISSTETENT